MKPGNEVKARLFAMYLGQPAKCKKPFNANRNSIGKNGKLCMSPSILADIHEGTFNADDFYLLLRPIESLTDEEVLIIGELWVREEIRKDKAAVKFFRTQLNKYFKENYACASYALRIGIALPFTYLDENQQPQTSSVTEQVEMGWIKLVN